MTKSCVVANLRSERPSSFLIPKLQPLCTHVRPTIYVSKLQTTKLQPPCMTITSCVKTPTSFLTFSSSNTTTYTHYTIQLLTSSIQSLKYKLCHFHFLKTFITSADFPFEEPTFMVYLLNLISSTVYSTTPSPRNPCLNTKQT